MEIGRDARAIFKAVSGNWDTDKFKTLLEKKGLGIEELAEIVVDLSKNADSRTRLKCVSLVMECTGLKQVAAENNVNIMINNIMNAPQAELEQFLMDWLSVAEVKNIETKEE